MEIKQAQLPLAMPATTMDDDAGKAARNSATAQEAPVTVSADGSDAMQEALLNAARDMHDAQSARWAWTGAGSTAASWMRCKRRWLRQRSARSWMGGARKRPQRRF